MAEEMRRRTSEALQFLARTRMSQKVPKEDIVKQLVAMGAGQDVAKHIVNAVVNEESSATEMVDLSQQFKTATAIVLFAKGDMELASVSFKEVLSIDRNNTDALFYMGMICDQLGELDQAIKFMRRAAVIQPQYRELYHFGLILKRRGLLRQAMQQFRKAVILQPRMIEARFQMAHTLALNSNFVGSVDMLQRIIAIDPDYAAARALLARLVGLSPALQKCGMPMELPKLSRDVSDEFNLPPQVWIDLVDVGNPSALYGLTRQIANKLGMRTHPPNLALWPQGWDSHYGEGDFSPLEAHMVEVMEGASLWISHDTMLLLATEAAADWARLYGFKSKAVGLPFCYADHDERSKRVLGSLLVMPAHGGGVDESARTEYLEYIKSITQHFSRVVFCLNSDSVSGARGWHKDLDNHGFDFVVGASIFDQNSIPRMRKIFDSFEYMTTNTKGSHLLCASFCGVKVSLAGPFYDPFLSRRDTIRRGVRMRGGILEGDDAYEVTYEHDYLTRNYPWFFVEPQHATKQEEWAKKEIGFYNKVSFEELARLFGWLDANN